MAYIEGLSKPTIGSNSYRLILEENLSPGSNFMWRISSDLHQSEYQPMGQSISVIFTGQHIGMFFNIEVNYKDCKGKWRYCRRDVTVKAEATVASPKPQMPQADVGNKSAVINSEANGEEENLKEIVLKIHVYFDGTFGNRNNIDYLNRIISGEQIDLKVKKPDINDFWNEQGELDKEGYEEANRKYQEALKAKKDEIKELSDPRSEKEKAEVVAKKKLDSKEKQKKDAIKHGFDPTKDDISYTQVYTNIPKMYDIEEIKRNNTEQNKERIIKVYVEGVGTKNKDEDSMLALAIGIDGNKTDIPAKITRAFEDIKFGINTLKIKNEKITSVEVCVIGFSRGAATSRNFVAEKERLVSELRTINKSIPNITYRFVGIFDTVCSVTKDLVPRYSLETEDDSIHALDNYVTRIQRHNIEEFKLAMGGNVKEVVHLTAADEYRTFFPLTNIQTSIDAGCGYELMFPGSHCDLGGGDKDIIPEKYIGIRIRV